MTDTTPQVSPEDEHEIAVNFRMAAAADAPVTWLEPVSGKSLYNEAAVKRAVEEASRPAPADEPLKDGTYDDLDNEIITALTVDPRVQWSSKQRQAVRELIERHAPAVTSSGGDELEELLGWTIAKGVDAAVYLQEDPKKFDDIFREALTHTQAQLLAWADRRTAAAEQQARANALYEAADLVKDDPRYYQQLMTRRQETLAYMQYLQKGQDHE